MDPTKNNFRQLVDLVSQHNSWMDETISLIASENRLSPTINNVMQSDFGNRVAEGWLGERVFPGIKYYDEIEKYGMDLVKDIFHAEFADIRPISGTMANMIVFSAFTSPGDTIASISLSSGAHISMAGSTPKKVFNLKVAELPFNAETLNIDLPKSVEVLKSTRPKIMVLGGSVLLFKQPLEELAGVCKELGAIALFDASHVAGLVASGDYPNPFDQGADIVTMTTCKTIPGPQHAFILSKNEFSEKIKKTTFPGFLSGHHLHETVASVLVMEEYKSFGKDYSTQVLKNAKALAGYLSEAGFHVLAKEQGFTETHMFLVNVSSLSNYGEVEKKLERASILINRNMIPGDKSFINPSGLRLGTPEVTRLGMKEEDMKTISSFLQRLLLQNEDAEKIKKEVVKFRKKFKDIHYCFR